MTTDEPLAVQNEESLVSSGLSMKQIQTPHAAPCSRPRTFFASIPSPSHVIQLPGGHKSLSLNEDGYKTFTIELPLKENDKRRSTTATCVALMDAHGPGFVPPRSKKALETWRGSPGQQFLALLGNVLETVMGRIIRRLISECGPGTYALELTRRLGNLHQELDNELELRNAVLAENCGASLALAILFDGDTWLCNIGDCSMMLFDKRNGEPLKVWSNEGETGTSTSCPDILNLSAEGEGLRETQFKREHCVRRACGPNGIARHVVCSPHSAYAIFKTNCVGSFGHKHQLLKRTSVYRFCIRELCEKTSQGSVIVGLVSDGVTSLMTPSVIGSTLVSIEKTCSVLGGVENLLNGPMDRRPSELAKGNVKVPAAELLYGAIQHQKAHSTGGHHVPLRVVSEAVTSLASCLGAEKDASALFFDLVETQEESEHLLKNLKEAEVTPQEAPQEVQAIPGQSRDEEHVIAPGTLLFSPEMPLLSSVIMLPEISTARQTGHAFALESRDRLRIDFYNTKHAFSESDMLDLVKAILQTRYHDGKKRRRESDTENTGPTGHLSFSPTIQELLQRARDIRAEIQDSAPALQPGFEKDGVSDGCPAIEEDNADTTSTSSVEVSSYQSSSPRKRRKTELHGHGTVDVEAPSSQPDPASNSAASQPSERAEALRNEGEDGQELVSSPTTDALTVPTKNDTIDISNQYAQDQVDGKMASDDSSLKVEGTAVAKQEVNEEGQNDTSMGDRVIEAVVDSDEAMDVDVPLEDKCETLPVVSEEAMHDVLSVPYDAEPDPNVTDVDYVSQVEQERDTTCQQRTEGYPSASVVVPTLGHIMGDNPANRVASGAEPSSVMAETGFEAMHDIPVDGAHPASVVEKSSEAHSEEMMDGDVPCERDTILPPKACDVEIEALPRTDLTTTSTDPENNSTGASIYDVEQAADDALTGRQEDIKCITEPYQSDSDKPSEGSPEGDHNDAMDIPDGTVSDSSATIKISHDDLISNQKECGIIHVTREGVTLKVEMEDEESGGEESVGPRESISVKHGQDTECHSDVYASSDRVSDYADSQTTCGGSVMSPIIADELPNTVAEEQVVEYEGQATPEVAEVISSPTELPNAAADEEVVEHEEQDTPEAEDADADVDVSVSQEMEHRVFTFHEPSMLLTKTYNCGFSFAEGSLQLVSQEVVDRQEEVTVQSTNLEGNHEIHGLGIAGCQDQLVHEKEMHTSRSVESDETADNESTQSNENSQANKPEVEREELSGHGEYDGLSVALYESISFGPRLRTQGEESDDEDTDQKKEMREGAVDSVPLGHLDNADDGLEGDVSALPIMEGDKDDMGEEPVDQQPASSGETEGEQWC
ncbi:hypothetical protein SpCBS45565_g03268 [Spizellomyces sp. 'palustris']|nr:hypothetical protein SpCBS45565_g03268 [Spizellomyces sp. 'palustris']